MGERNKETRGGLPYTTMTVEEIINLPIVSLADKDCQLFLWAPNAHVHNAFHVMENWGFEYKTIITWHKTQIGLGYWLRGRSEQLLFGVRGKPRAKMIGPHGATGKNWSTSITAPRGKHSEKPQIFIEMIEDVSEEPRIELFARVKRLGWGSIGLEVGSDIREYFKNGFLYL